MFLSRRKMGDAVRLFVESNKKYVQLEFNEEVQKTLTLRERCDLGVLCTAGLAVDKLQVAEVKTQFAGRWSVQFASALEIPPGRITNGDVVSIAKSSNHRSVIASGLVSQVKNDRITIVCDSDDSANQLQDLVDRGNVCLLRDANSVTSRRLQKCLDEVQACAESKDCWRPGTDLLRVMFADTTDGCVADPGPSTRTELKLKVPLNQSQLDAVHLCLNDRRPVSMVHGPPGTGKTTVVCSIIEQLANVQKKRVLVCGPSNVSVDNVVQRLSDTFPPGRLVRLGHPVRVFQRLHPYVLECLRTSSDDAVILNSVWREIDKVKRELQRCDRAKRNRLRSDLKDLRAEAREREHRLQQSLLDNAQVVAATLTSCQTTREAPLGLLLRDALRKRDGGFDVVVIDECAQSVEPACWMALLLGKRCILVGDHCQLPPTVLSAEAASAGFATSLMERLLSPGSPLAKPTAASVLLRIQYRMHSDIMQWSSATFYDDQLLADASVSTALLSDDEAIESNEDTRLSMLLIDTRDCGDEYEELDTPEEMSKGNVGEVKLVLAHVASLVEAGVPQTDIAVISPYNLQICMLRECIHERFPAVEIRSVDGFQGQERLAVVLSLVRSNKHGEVGFLSERRRLNVAVTRARRHVAIVTNTATVSSDAMIASLIEHVTNVAECSAVRSALEYEDRVCQIDYEPNIEQFGVVSTARLVKALDVSEQHAKRKEKQKTQIKIRVEIKQTGTVSRDIPRSPRSFGNNIIDAPTLDDDARCMVENFANDVELETLQLPKSLDAYQRKLVHAFAESLDLVHKSVGEGTDRHIVLSRKCDNIDSAESEQSDAYPVVNELVEQNDTDYVAENESDDVEETPVTCPHCGKTDIPPYNLKLHVIQCGKIHARPTSVPTKPVQQKVKPKKSKNVKKVEVDEDALLNEAVKSSSRCPFDACKTSIAVIGERCSHCNRVFCMSHAQPEVHGCGEAAKKDARSSFGSAKKMKEEKRDVLQAALGAKINKMGADRKTKPQKKK